MLARNRFKFKGGVMQNGGALAEGAANADAQSYQKHGSTGDELEKHLDATKQAAHQIEGFQFQRGGYDCGQCNQVAGASDEQQQQICGMQAMECQQKVEAEYDYAMKGGYKYYPARRGINRSSSMKSRSKKESVTASHSSRSMKKRKGRRGKSLKDKSKKRKHKRKVKSAQKGGKKCGCKTMKIKRKLSKKNKRKINKRKSSKRGRK